MLFAALSWILKRHSPVARPADGVRLIRCGPGAWVADRELDMGRGMIFPVRMVLLEDSAKELICYAPVDLDESTLEAISGLGVVRRIIVPNRFHTSFVEAAAAHFPDASVVLPLNSSGLADRLSNLGGRVQVARESTALSARTEMKVVNLRKGFDELVLYYDPAELLVVSDLFFNLHQASGPLAVMLKLNGLWRRPAQSRLQRLLIMRDRNSLQQFYRWALGKPFSTISLSHGQLITQDARETFYQLFRRYRG